MMSSREYEKIRERQLQVIGSLLAGFSHELKNHLAVIKESNGLLIDLIDLGRVENPALQVRLQKITETIEVRTRKIAVMAQHLSGFSHRNDTPFSSFHLHEILNEELAFLSRFAELKSISVSVSFSQGLPIISNDPALVQFVFSSLFFFLLPTLEPGGSINVFTDQKEDVICIGLRLEGKIVETVVALDDLDGDHALQTALKMVGATLSIRSAGGMIRTLICSFPPLRQSH